MLKILVYLDFDNLNCIRNVGWINGLVPVCRPMFFFVDFVRAEGKGLCST